MALYVSLYALLHESSMWLTLQKCWTTCAFRHKFYTFRMD